MAKTMVAIEIGEVEIMSTASIMKFFGQLSPAIVFKIKREV